MFTKFRVIVIVLIVFFGFFVYGKKEEIYTGYLLETFKSEAKQNIHLKKEAIVLTNNLKTGGILSEDDKNRLKELHEQGIISATLALIQLEDLNECEMLNQLILNMDNSAILEAEISSPSDHARLNNIFTSENCLSHSDKWKSALFNANNDDNNIFKRLRYIEKKKSS